MVLSYKYTCIGMCFMLLWKELLVLNCVKDHENGIFEICRNKRWSSLHCLAFIRDSSLKWHFITCTCTCIFRVPSFIEIQKNISVSPVTVDWSFLAQHCKERILEIIVIKLGFLVICYFVISYSTCIFMYWYWNIKNEKSYGKVSLPENQAVTG